MTAKTSVSLQQAQAIQDALHQLAQSPHFVNSAFLRIIQQQIYKISQDFDKTVQTVYFEEEPAPIHASQNQDMQTVYISLYCSDGAHLASWDRVILNLPKQYISRPIFLREQDAQKSLKAKPQLLNEGYVAVLVDKKNICSVENELFNLQDKFGHRLLTLKDRAIELNHVLFFWHNSKHYDFINNSLFFSKSVPDFIQED